MDKETREILKEYGQRYLLSVSSAYRSYMYAERGNWKRANELFQGYGIEYVSCCEKELKYINTGDTYSITIGDDGTGVFVGTWGGWYEEIENQYCKDNNVIRCAWCSSYTEVANPWDTTVCSSCGNNVSGN